MRTVNEQRINDAIETIEKNQQLSEIETEVLTEYLNDKNSLSEPLTEAEEHLMGLLPAFTPDDDSEVKLGDYVDDREMACAEFGYDIYDKKETLQSLERRLSKGEEIGDSEKSQLVRIWQFDVSNYDEVKQQMKKAGL